MIAVTRKENKYVMHQHEFALLREKLAILMHKDPHGGDFGYPVRSLYFDSVYDNDYYAAAEGLQKKSKIRLRLYPGYDVIKLELKEKDGTESCKRSLTLTREEAEKMQRCDYGFLAQRPEETAHRIYLQLLQGAYRPKTLVEYDREAYTYPAGDVRVTFDTDTRATASACSLFEENPPWMPAEPASTGVLEVKYSSMLPSVLKGVIETGRQTSANSKYVKARQLY